MNIKGRGSLKILHLESRVLLRLSSIPLPTQYALYQNYPNPFNPETVIEYDIPKDDHVEIEIYDVLGEKIQTLINERINAGKHKIKFDAKKLSSGTYFYRLRSDKLTITKKLLLLK